MSRIRPWHEEKSAAQLRELSPDAFEKFVAFEDAAFAPGQLSTKFKELLAVGITHVTQCDACTTYHARKAKEAGASDAEIAEVVMVAMSLRAGAALGQFARTARVMEQARSK